MALFMFFFLFCNQKSDLISFHCKLKTAILVIVKKSPELLETRIAIFIAQAQVSDLFKILIILHSSSFPSAPMFHNMIAAGPFGGPEGSGPFPAFETHGDNIN